MVVKTGFKMTFGGVDLMRWIDGVQTIERDVGQNMTNSLIKIGREPGEHFQYTSPAHGTITVTALILNNPDRRALASALTVDNPQQLVFGDEPDKYYMAIPDAQATLTEAYWNNVLTIVFIVPDAIAHSVTTKAADNAAVDGTLGDELVVQNDGTYPVYPVIEATMHSDNGVLTLINESNGGVIQLGNPGEIDGVQAPDSETAFHYDLLSAPSGVAVNTGTINYPTYPYGSNPGPNTIAGSWDYLLNKDAATPVLNRTSSMHWAGPTYHGPIKANAAGVNTGNLIWSNRFNVTTSVGALGRVEFSLQSGDDIAVCFVMRDSTQAADALTVEGWVNGQNIFSQDLNRKLFTNGMYEIVESKLGNTITFKLTKIKQLSASGIISSAQTVFPPVTIDGVADTPIDSFTVWMAGFSNKTGWTINWSDSVFQWVNVDYWKDLPNRFTDGDTLLVDPSQIKVFVNDVEDRTLHAIDNDWEKFRLDPGETKIKIIASDFAATPTVVATYREAFL